MRTFFSNTFREPITYKKRAWDKADFWAKMKLFEITLALVLTTRKLIMVKAGYGFLGTDGLFVGF